MKTRFFLAFALVLSMFQGWAVPVDTVKNQTSSLSKITQRENLLFGDSIAKRNDSGTLDGIELIDLGSIDGIERMDGKITAETTSSNGSSKIRIYSPGNLNQEITSLSFSTLLVEESQTKEIIVQTRGISGTLKVQVEGTDKKMFSVKPSSLDYTQTDINYNLDGNGGAKVRVTYNPTKAGYHEAKLVVKQTTIFGIVLVKKTIALTGRAKCEIKVNKTNLPFVNAEPQKFRLQCKHATGKVYLDVMGTGKDYFWVSPTTISKSKAVNENIITVYCSCPSSLKKVNAHILITSDDADAKKVDLVYVKRTNGSNSTTSSDDEVQESPGVECEETPDVEVQEATPSDDIEEAPDEASQQEWGAPVNAAGLDEMMMDVRIFAEGQNIIIESSTQQSAIISDLTGRARSVNLQVGRNEIPVNFSGVYVVRVGKESKKLMLR